MKVTLLQFLNDVLGQSKGKLQKIHTCPLKCCFIEHSTYVLWHNRIVSETRSVVAGYIHAAKKELPWSSERTPTQSTPTQFFINITGASIVRSISAAWRSDTANSESSRMRT